MPFSRVVASTLSRMLADHIRRFDDGTDRCAGTGISRFEMVPKRRDRTAVALASYRTAGSIAQVAANFSRKGVRAALERSERIPKNVSCKTDNWKFQ
jgi:hypothetical protein